MIKNNLLKCITLPYKTVKGSETLRHQKACKFTDKIINNLSGQLDNEGISLSKFARKLGKLLPKKLSFFVKKNSFADAEASLSRVYNEKDKIATYYLGITPNKNKKITRLEITTIAHEMQHLADALFNPKALSREQCVTQKGLDTKKILNFYSNKIYNLENFNGKKDKNKIIKTLRNKTKNILKGFSAKDKINILQYMRYSLSSEKNAYTTEYKWAKKLNKKNIPIYEDSLNNYNKEYMFNEKLMLLKNMAFELIKKERGKTAAKLKNKKVTNC